MFEWKGGRALGKAAANALPARVRLCSLLVAVPRSPWLSFFRGSSLLLPNLLSAFAVSGARQNLLSATREQAVEDGSSPLGEQRASSLIIQCSRVPRQFSAGFPVHVSWHTAWLAPGHTQQGRVVTSISLLRNVQHPPCASQFVAYEVQAASVGCGVQCITALPQNKWESLARLLRKGPPCLSPSVHNT